VIILPLARTPSQDEMNQLESILGQVTIARENFEVRDQSPRTIEQALSDKIPSDLLKELPRSFGIVGDIAILEFNPRLIPFQKIVATAIVAVHPNIRAVFAKAGAITGIERLRPLRHIAGENRTRTTHKESGCVFSVDLSKAFFSPRLSTERQRVANEVKEGERVLDMFAGVGPFSILIAKRLDHIEVDAIDSNPDATRLIEENAYLNKVQSKLHIWTGDARDIVPQHLEARASRVIMNHPSESKDFIDVACHALQHEGAMIHYYTFAEGEDCEGIARREFEDGLRAGGCELDDIPVTRRVREVGPMKWQVAVEAKAAPRL